MNDQSHAFEMLEGVHLARLCGFSNADEPLIELEGNILPACTLVSLDQSCLDRQVAIIPLAGSTERVLILGLTEHPKPRRKVIEAEEELHLRCGKSSVTLEANGHVTVSGKQLLSRADGQNRVQGASVQLN